MSHGRHRTISAEGIARVEGEGSLRVEVRDGEVGEVALTIFEPPRFFEALLVGRHFSEAPDVTARVCGICPVAYQLSACAAMEDALGVEVEPAIKDLRRLLYCGEWIQSHALHVYLLHAPDFFGCADAIELAELDASAVRRGLDLKKTGNLVMGCVGGRAVHPLNVKVGGFYKAPDPASIAALVEPLARAREQALATLEWVAGFEFPDVEGSYHFVALADEGRYAIEGGRPADADGAMSPALFASRAVEEHVERSSALVARLDGSAHYLTGPLARYALNGRWLAPEIRQAARDAGLGEVCANPFKSIVVRSLELVVACDEALRLAKGYEFLERPCAEVPVHAGAGTGVTEAPRGLLLHEYELDDRGLIRRARLMPPTSQNQLTIEDDLRRVVQGGLELGDDELQRRCEQAVRNHDPCISCAAHFLDLTVVRS